MNKDTQIKQLEESNAKMKADIEAQAKMIAELKLPVIKKRERVAKGETYWIIDPVGDIESRTEGTTRFDIYRFNSGNYYYSESEAQLVLDKELAQQRIFDALREHEGDWELKFKRRTNNSRIYLNTSTKLFHCTSNDEFQEIPDARWYSSEESCKWVIDNMENDLKICFGVR